jgi:hypothetical protein
MKLVSLLVISLLVGAGCTSKDAEVAPEPIAPSGVEGVSGNEQVNGFIFDNAVAPLDGATIVIASMGIDATSDVDGRYAFEGLPTDQVLVFTAKADGFVPVSKSVQLIPDTVLKMNFTLEPVPVAKPYYEVLSFDGIIACSSITRENNNVYRNDCAPPGTPDEKVWEFAVAEQTAGVVIEVAWDAQSDAARHLNLTVETVGFGDLDETLIMHEGESILRGQISNSKATRFYTDGGIVRVKVDIGRNTADEEVNAGNGFAAQQGFEVFASVFYVSPPPGSYTIAT